MNEAEEIKQELMEEISLAVQKVAAQKEMQKVGSLTRCRPEKAAKLIYLYSIGNSQTRLVKKYGFDRELVIGILVDFADYMGRFRELSGKMASRNYMSMSSLEEDLIEKVRDRMESGDIEPTFRDLKELSIAKTNAAREALTARGEATQITEDRHTYSQEDYEDTLRAARERIAKMKQAEIIEV